MAPPRSSAPHLSVLVGNKYRHIRPRLLGMSDAHKPENERNSGPVALKLLHPQFSRESNVARRFEQAARAAAPIRHPDIDEVRLNISQ